MQLDTDRGKYVRKRKGLFLLVPDLLSSQDFLRNTEVSSSLSPPFLRTTKLASLARASEKELKPALGSISAHFLRQVFFSTVH